MNKANITLVADTIEDHAYRGVGLRGVGFNMAAFCDRSYKDQIGDCRTVACIAGWACIIKHSLNIDTFESFTYTTSVSDEAADFLGLSQADKGALFIAYGAGKFLDEITTTDAVKVLRHLAETGKVVWEIIHD